MALRRQINEADASFADPVLGINLRESEENLKGGESRLMQNCEYYGGGDGWTKKVQQNEYH